MSKVVIQGNASGTGNFTIAAPNSNTDRTLALPDEAGTVLTSSSSIASSQLPTDAKGFVLLNSVTASGDADVSFTLDTTNYDDFKIIISNLTAATTSSHLQTRYSIDNGSSYVSTSSYARSSIGRRHAGSTDAESSNADSVGQITVSESIMGADAGESYGVECTFIGLSSNYAKLIATTSGKNTASNMAYTLAAIQFQNTSPITNIKFFLSAGNIAAGTFRLYGLAK